MKTFLIILVSVAAAALTGFLVAERHDARHAAELAAKAAQWDKERAELETALLKARNRPVKETVVERTVEAARQLSPGEIIDRLKTQRVAANDPQSARKLVHQLELLIETGDSALPAIREFLEKNEDIEFDTPLASWKGGKEGKIQIDFVVPPSLRFGLFDVVRRIGGEEAEKVLADMLGVTGRGAEIGYLARVLQEIAPFKYRDLAVTIARDLLASNAITGSGVDKYDRNYLYGVLGLYGDASFAAQAQEQLIRADGQIDIGALKYIQQTVGTQALSVVANAYQDPRITDPGKKEPLARYLLTYVGANTQADTLYRATISDPSMPLDSRRELIEDLNQDGIENEKHPTARDYSIIKNRLDFIARNRNSSDPQLVTDAYNEAEKDLRDMAKDYESRQQ